MTNYVLEILDGDQQGDVFPLAADRNTVGRRSDNSLVIRDEKCSGRHAEVVFEDGGWVVRDLGSTNGTMIDGQKITEVALSAFDVVQFGRVRVVFKEEGAEAPAGATANAGAGAAAGAGDLQVARLDAARLAAGRKKKGSLVTMLLVLVLIGGGGAAAWLQFFSGQAGPGRRVARPPLEVRGNLLEVGTASFEDDGGWDLQVAGAGFDLAVGRARAHTGETAVEASGAALTIEDGDDEEQADESPAPVGPRRFALARLAAPATVASGSPVRATMFLKTADGGRGAVRLRFTSSADGSELTTGSAPVASADDGGDWREVEFIARVPSGMDRVEVELLAVLPSDDATVLVDDVAVVADRGLTVPDHEHSSKNGRTLSGTGGSFRIVSGEVLSIVDVLPLTTDSSLAELAAEDLLTPTDAGLTLETQDLDGTGFRVQYAAGEGVVDYEGFALLASPDYAGTIALATPDGVFSPPQAPDFEQAGVAAMLVGAGDTRTLLRFETPAAVKGVGSSDLYRIELRGSTSVELVVVFDDEARKARELVRQAEGAQRDGRIADALDALDTALSRHPHDDRAARDALTLRAQILRDLNERIANLRSEGGEARFFNARVGYRRVAQGIDDLIETFGERHLPDPDVLQQLRSDMQAGLAALAARDGAEHGAKLSLLADAFAGAGQTALATVVRTYTESHYADDRGDEGGR